MIAALGFRMRPEGNFRRVLNVARFGSSGETFAFDRTGLLLSESRFDDELKRIGLIADAAPVRSTLAGAPRPRGRYDDRPWPSEPAGPSNRLPGW